MSGSCTSSTAEMLAFMVATGLRLWGNAGSACRNAEAILEKWYAETLKESTQENATHFLEFPNNFEYNRDIKDL